MRKIWLLVPALLLSLGLIACQSSPGEPPTYSLAVSPEQLSIARGAERTIDITLTRPEGFGDDVALSLEGAPAGVTGSFSETVLTGSISNSTLTVEASSSTAQGSYTLRVVGKAGSETRTAEFTLTVSSLTVSGRVVDMNGQSLAGVNVKIGDYSTPTNANGEFSFDGVTVPYDVTVYSVTDAWAETFVGITRSDPTLQLINGAALATTNTALLSGELSPAVPVPADNELHIALGSSETQAFGGTALIAGEGPAYPSVGSGTYQVAWLGAGTVNGTLHALQIAYDAAGFPSSYPAYGSLAVPLADDADISDKNIVMGAGPPTVNLSGSVSGLPSGFDLSLSQFVTLNGDTMLVLFNQVDSSASFDLVSPGMANGSHIVLATATGPNGEQAIAWVTGLEPDASSVNLALPQGLPTLVSPADAATGIAAGEQLTFTSPLAEAVNIVQVFPSSGPGPSYSFVTTGTSVTIPDLSAQGLDLPASTEYTWNVTSLMPVSSMDEATGNRPYLTDFNLLAKGIAVGGGGPGPELDMTGTLSASRTFTTAP